MVSTLVVGDVVCPTISTISVSKMGDDFVFAFLGRQVLEIHVCHKRKEDTDKHAASSVVSVLISLI